MEVGLYINGERCPKDAAQCSPSKGNILITYDTSSLRVRSPETLSSSNDSDVIILGNGTGEKALPVSNAREGDFARSLRSLKTPSPREIVTQWLQASPAYKTPEVSPTIVVEHTVEDKEESARSGTPSEFEIFDLRANRMNNPPSVEVPAGSGIPLSPETSRKQELCSYLQLMNMNSKSDKQRTNIRSSFHRRSNRVKNLIVQIEKRKLEERIYNLNANESAKLRGNAILNGQRTAKPLPETPECSDAILQGFTPSLGPVKLPQRRSAFDIAMRRFITDERIAIRRPKRPGSLSSDDGQSEVAKPRFPRNKAKSDKLVKRRRSSTTLSVDCRSDTIAKNRRKPIKADYARSEHTQAKKIKDRDNKEKIKRVPKIIKVKKRKYALKGTKNEKVKKKLFFSVERDLTVFEKEIAKVTRLSQKNARSLIHNLRDRKNRHKENLPNKVRIENVLKTKQKKIPLHRNNGINNLAKLKLENKKVDEDKLVKLKLFQEKQVEIVDLSANCSKPNKEIGAASPLTKGFNSTKINDEEVPNWYLIDHTYVRLKNDSQNLRVEPLGFCGFAAEEQEGSNEAANLASETIQSLLEDIRQHEEARVEITPEAATTESRANLEGLENEDIDIGLQDGLIRYNMHDYSVPERLNSESTSSRDESSSDSSEISSNSPVAEEIKRKEIPVGVIAPKVTQPDNDKVETEPNLNFSNRITRPVTPPTYIPFKPQGKTPSKTLHRNLQTRRKTPTIQQDVPRTPPSNSNSSNHCATLVPSDGRLLHAEYSAGQLVASQERLITCWAQTPLGHILHSQELWIARGAVVRQQFGEDSVLKHMNNRLMIVDNIVSYVEIWVKEHKSVFRERPVADVFAVLYSWKPNQTVEKKLIQLENIKGSADDVQCIILKKSRSVLVSWSIMQTAIKQVTVLHLYELSPDYQRVLTIKELKSIGTKIQSLHMIEDNDDLVIGCGENCVNIWNIEYGYIVATLDMPDTLPEPKCLWTLCNQGFVFLLQECNDGLLRLIAINGMKIKITWKNLKLFNPPKEYYNLLGVCLENGILITCYENGILSWNVQTSELLTEEPLPMEDMAPFSSPSCFLSDSHLVQLERNGHIQVRHVLYHLLTSSDLSM